MQMQLTWYEIHETREDDTIEDGYYAHEGYSRYYQNKLRYNLDDAKAHKVELESKGLSGLVIVKVTQIKKVVS